MLLADKQAEQFGYPHGLRRKLREPRIAADTPAASVCSHLITSAHKISSEKSGRRTAGNADFIMGRRAGLRVVVVPQAGASSQLAGILGQWPATSDRVNNALESARTIADGGGE